MSRPTASCPHRCDAISSTHLPAVAPATMQGNELELDVEAELDKLEKRKARGFMDTPELKVRAALP